MSPSNINNGGLQHKLQGLLAQELKKRGVSKTQTTDRRPRKRRPRKRRPRKRRPLDNKCSGELRLQYWEGSSK